MSASNPSTLKNAEDYVPKICEHQAQAGAKEQQVTHHRHPRARCGLAALCLSRHTLKWPTA